MKQEDLLNKLDQFGTWMYKFKLTDEITTRLHGDWLTQVHDTRYQMIFPKLNEIFNSKWSTVTCLDVACNEGYFGFEVLRLGAKQVVGFDARQINIDKANFIKDYFDYKNIQFHVDDIYNLDVNQYGTFDLTLCLGLIYHLENPMLALRKIRDVTKKICVIDTQTIRFDPKTSSPDTIKTANGSMHNIVETDAVIGLFEERDTETNQCASITGLSCFPNKAAVFKMLKFAGFSEIIQLAPPSNAYEQYANFERIIVLAKV